MDIYKKGLKEGLLIQTEKGLLRLDQLFKVSQSVLAKALKDLHEQLSEQQEVSDDLAFLNDNAPVKDGKLQLTFDILKDIYTTNQEELDQKKTAAANKVHNAKILDLITRKQESAAEELSIEELQKLLK